MLTSQHVSIATSRDRRMFLRECTPHAIVVIFVAQILIARVEQVCEEAERQQNLPGNDTPIVGM